MQKIVIIGFLIFLFLAACAPVAKNPAPTTYPGIQVTYPSTEKKYRLQVGDTLDIKFFYNPELNEQVTLRPDGKISLQLTHEIMAADLTPGELTDLLTREYAPELISSGEKDGVRGPALSRLENTYAYAYHIE